MIRLFCSKCGSELVLGKEVRYSDQYQVNIEPCGCSFQHAVEDLQLAMGEPVHVVCDSEIDSMVDENNSLLLYNEMKEDLAKAYQSQEYFEGKWKGVKRKLKKLKYKLGRKEQQVARERSDFANARRSFKLVIEKKDKRNSESLMERDRMQVENANLSARVVDLSFKLREAIVRSQNINYRRSIEI